MALVWNPNFGIKAEQGFEKIQANIDADVLRYLPQYTPRLTGVLIKSGTTNTVVGSGLVRQRTPYGPYQYYNHKSKKLWFETLKADKRTIILADAQKTTGEEFPKE